MRYYIVQALLLLAIVPALFLTLRAGTFRGFEITGNDVLAIWVETTGNAFISKPKPENGRCPVCGAQHEHYYRQQVACGAPGGACFIAADSRLVRCKRCNAAFFQDAETKPVSK